MRPTFLVVIILVLIITGVIVVQFLSKKTVKEPVTEKSVTETEVLSTEETVFEQKKVQIEKSEREIIVTDGVKHSIPLEEIISGGPPKDGIPSIDNPKFISIKEANKFLNDDEPGVVFSRGNTHRFYPYQILVWHEMVNDTVEGERILVTYCPLCLTGYIFDPLVKGERVEFGTSGKLWKSNLVMYDRKTDSLWPQILGEAVVGEMTGTKLSVLPSDQARYGKWKKLHPDGHVLSRDTGASKFYGSSPYGDYFSVTNLSLSLARPTDTRLPNDAFVFGIVTDGKSKAYHVEAIKAKGVVEDIFENTTILLRYDKELDVVRMFRRSPAGDEERINPFSAFWFSWAVAHPDTELYK
ncbi:DUF3179 domain-containing protein [Patescibacteria group bacterium AH-259-L05]|nr:DUF3179 domain-containing protein [Patescibacteria group bacterium AH-259-L05]